MARLADEGVLEARPGHGTFLAARPAEPPPAADFAWQGIALGAGRITADDVAALLAGAPAGAINLAGGYPAEDLQAVDLVSRALARAARRPGVWGRMPLEGIDGLRTWFARQLGPAVTAREVVVCPGSQAAIATAFHALTEPGSPVLVESPSYVGALVAARAAGLRLVPVPTDADGVVPELLARAFETSGARVFYTQPLHANPSGATLAAGRRRQVLDIVARHRALRHRGRLVPRPVLREVAAAAADLRRSARALRLPALADQVDGAWPAHRRHRRPRRGAGPAHRQPGRRRVLRVGADAGSRARSRARPGVAAPPAAACARRWSLGATCWPRALRRHFGESSLALRAVGRDAPVAAAPRRRRRRGPGPARRRRGGHRQPRPAVVPGRADRLVPAGQLRLRRRRPSWIARSRRWRGWPGSERRAGRVGRLFRAGCSGGAEAPACVLITRSIDRSRDHPIARSPDRSPDQPITRSIDVAITISPSTAATRWSATARR